MYITAFSVPQGVVTVLLGVFNTLCYLFFWCDIVLGFPEANGRFRVYNVTTGE